MQDPKRYEEYKTSSKEIVEEFLPKLINGMKWNNEEIVLDYGCGAGSPGYQHILPKVQEFNSKMYSVDVSSNMLDYAKEHFPHELISYGVGDILDKFPFEDVKFDKIFVVSVFHFIKDIRKALAGLHKILKPGGKLGFTMRLAECPTFQAFKEMSESETWKPYMETYEQFYPAWSEFPKGLELSCMKELLESSGFNICQIEFLRKNYRFDPLEDLLEAALSANPCLNSLPKDLYGAFQKDLKIFYTTSTGIPLDSQTYDFKFDLIWGVIEKGQQSK